MLIRQVSRKVELVSCESGVLVAKEMLAMARSSTLSQLGGRVRAVAGVLVQAVLKTKKGLNFGIEGEQTERCVFADCVYDSSKWAVFPKTVKSI